MTTSYRVRVVNGDELSAWSESIPTEPGENPHFACVRHIEATGETVLWYEGEGFYLMCPGCGSALGGRFGEHPVSGWDAPRWVNTGTRERPTLAPSLGCWTWRLGDCIGHWWLRDGELTLA